MAIQNKTLSGAEHDWYATRSGAPANAPLSQHQRMYYTSKGITGKKPLSQMEEEWLSTLTGVTSDRYADKWVEAVAGQGFTPRQRLSENKFIFFTSVTGSP